MTISSIPTGTVESWPSTTIAALSPTRTRSTPASSATWPEGKSYAVTITIGSPLRFISATLGTVIGARSGGATPAGCCCSISLGGRVTAAPPRASEPGRARTSSLRPRLSDHDVVDQPGAPDGRGDGDQHGPAVELGDEAQVLGVTRLHVLRLDPGGAKLALHDRGEHRGRALAPGDRVRRLAQGARDG